MIGHAPRRGDDGFTLVEMLVALGLLAIASGLAVEGFAASRGAVRRIAAHDARVGSVASAEMRLRDRLEAMVVRARFETAKPYVDIDGAPDRLDFIAAPSPGAPPTRERLALDEAGDLSVQDVAPGEGSQTNGPAGRLLAGASTLEIAYYGRTAGEAEAAWRPDWSREPSAPELVRVRVGFAPGDRRVWPDLIVRPAAEVDGDCVVDADTAACRGRT